MQVRDGERVPGMLVRGEVEMNQGRSGSEGCISSDQVECD